MARRRALLCSTTVSSLATRRRGWALSTRVAVGAALSAGELDGDFGAVGRGAEEEGVFLPGGEEGLDHFVAGADEGGDDGDALRGLLGEDGLGDGLARGVGGASRQGEREGE